MYEKLWRTHNFDIHFGKYKKKKITYRTVNIKIHFPFILIQEKFSKKSHIIYLSFILTLNSFFFFFTLELKLCVKKYPFNFSMWSAYELFRDMVTSHFVVVEHFFIYDFISEI